MSTTTGQRRSVVVREYPTGMPDEKTFEVVTSDIPTPGPGEVVTRNHYLSIDPYMRGRITARKSYAAPVPIGGVMTGETVGEVIASGDPAFVVGDVVVGARGWETHSLTSGKMLTKITGTLAPLSTYLGVLGMPGVTAYYGMKDIGEPKAGETVLISAASGAVGAVAGQIAKRAGCRVVGIAGGPEKCRYVIEELGFDACIDHYADDILGAIGNACPKGVDIYFENVGGKIQEAAFAHLNVFGRVIMCGMVSQYNATEAVPGPNLMFTVAKRVKIQGLIVSDKLHYFKEWRDQATPWVLDNSFKFRETVVDGIESAPQALVSVLSGGNFGKMVVKLI